MAGATLPINGNKRQRAVLPAGPEGPPDIRFEIIRCQNIAHDATASVAAAVIRSRAIPVQTVVTKDGTLSTRPDQDDDEAFLFALFASVKGPDFALLPEVIRTQLLRMQYRAMTQSYHQSWPDAAFDILTLGGHPIGRLITDTSDHCLHIVYIALLPSWRNRGLASALMRSVMFHADTLRLSGRATVAIGNDASMRLWAGLGFTEQSRSDTDVILYRESR